MPGEGSTEYTCPTAMYRLPGYHFRPFFFNRVSKEGSFSGAGCQKFSKGKTLLDQVVFSQIFLSWNMF